MSDPLLPVGDGDTEVPDDDRASLIPSYIATLGELHAAEFENIATATFGRRPSAETLLDDMYLRQLHRDMFDRVWTWAGRYRILETNIGIDPGLITPSIRDLTADTAALVGSHSIEMDVIALRFHHRLVQIHPFVNGNGRHGRVAADLLVSALGRPTFTWGRNLNISTQELRTRYVASLRQMDVDRENVTSLVSFARS